MTPLEESYRRCRELTRRSGTTYYWSTYLLPQDKRRHVHALYGFCRYADDIVDTVGPDSVDARRRALARFGDRFLVDLSAGRSADPILAAVVDSARTYELGADLFERFLRSMTMDLSVATYDTFDDLLVYMDGSAAVIGEMMLPLLEPLDPAAAMGAARDLGVAFQLTNFLRDVAEDRDRGRTYLPQEDLECFGARAALDAGQVSDEWRALLRFEIERTRGYYRSADPGIALLPASSARCVAAARDLYGGILDRIEDADGDVFSRRVRVPAWRKVAAAARGATPALPRRLGGRRPRIGAARRRHTPA